MNTSYQLLSDLQPISKASQVTKQYWLIDGVQSSRETHNAGFSRVPMGPDFGKARFTTEASAGWSQKRETENSTAMWWCFLERGYVLAWTSQIHVTLSFEGNVICKNRLELALIVHTSAALIAQSRHLSCRNVILAWQSTRVKEPSWALQSWIRYLDNHFSLAVRANLTGLTWGDIKHRDPQCHFYGIACQSRAILPLPTRPLSV